MKIILLGWLLTGSAFAVDLTVTKIRDLTFPDSVAGDGTSVVAATSGAEFLLQGDANARLDSVLPGSVELFSPCCRGVFAGSWISSPNNNWRLDAIGRLTVRIGATATGIDVNRTPGTYNAPFIIQSRYRTTGPWVQGTAQAVVKIISSLSLSTVRDLDFGPATLSDPSLTLAPTQSGAAAFTVQGEASHSYTIVLPGSVTMKTGTINSPRNRIVVSPLTSLPSPSGVLSGSGHETLFVAGTRAAILSNQVAGSYSASFTVSIAY